MVTSACPQATTVQGGILGDFARVALAREEVWNVVVRSCAHRARWKVEFLYLESSHDR